MGIPCFADLPAPLRRERPPLRTRARRTRQLGTGVGVGDGRPAGK